MKLKKSLATLLTAALTITTAFPACNVFADDVVTDVVEAKDVYVTIVNAGQICYDKDENPITVKKYNVSDKNSNGAIDIDDAFITVHEEAGFSDGYATIESVWGKAVAKLWGIENGGAYGYYVNNVSAMGISDTLEDGDYLSASDRFQADLRSGQLFPQVFLLYPHSHCCIHQEAPLFSRKDPPPFRSLSCQ